MATNSDAAGVFFARLFGADVHWPQRTHLAIEIPSATLPAAAPAVAGRVAEGISIARCVRCGQWTSAPKRRAKNTPAASEFVAITTSTSATATTPPSGPRRRARFGLVDHRGDELGLAAR